MAWARIDDGFHDHPKVDGLSLAAVGLWTLTLTWAHRHRRGAVVPGHITDARVSKVAGKDAARLSAELVDAGMWDVESHIGGWVIHDFADYGPKDRDPEERSLAGRKGAANRWQRAKQADGKLPSEPVANDMATDASCAATPAFPSRPVLEDPPNPPETGGTRAPSNPRALGTNPRGPKPLTAAEQWRADNQEAS